MRRTSDSITRQSLKAIEGLSNQADMLRGVSENLVQQISGVTNRFDNQGQSIVNAASALEGGHAAHRLTLQKRQAANDTCSACRQGQQLDEVMRGYSATVEGTLADAEARAHRLIEQLAQGTTAHAQAAVKRSSACVSRPTCIPRRWCPLSSACARRPTRNRRRWLPSSSACGPRPTRRPCGPSRTCGRRCRARPRRVHASGANLQHEQERLRAEAERLPIVTRESAEAMRTALNDQLRALEQLSSLTRPRAPRRDPARPAGARRAAVAHGSLCGAGGRPPPPPAVPAAAAPR